MFWYLKCGFFFFFIFGFIMSVFYYLVGWFYFDYYFIGKFCRFKCEIDIYNKILNIYYKIIEYK